MSLLRKEHCRLPAFGLLDAVEISDALVDDLLSGLTSDLHFSENDGRRIRLATNPGQGLVIAGAVEEIQTKYLVRETRSDRL